MKTKALVSYCQLSLIIFIEVAIHQLKKIFLFERGHIAFELSTLVVFALGQVADRIVGNR